jgi:hypothetical protein
MRWARLDDVIGFSCVAELDRAVPGFRIGAPLTLLPEKTMQEYFGSRNHEEIWRGLTTNSDHRSKVIEWLDAMLTTQVSGEIDQMNKKASALKIQETYSTSKGITMKRYIDKE